MSGHCDVEWCICRQTRQNGALSLVDDESMLEIIKDIASVGDAQESIAITGVPGKFHDTVDRSEVILESMSFTPDLELACVDFLCGN